ncbi:MAG TPA: aromatic aminobenezylarsenical efflux permease ArsG family transporter [Candidatus Krumholzibacteria bacterium]|nr:aromatic aminobenezylarsenical efflux permease ArsG family transporter [Candidatus Krumholzibacteria bacterium]
MTEVLAAAGSALWLGILTSISPCPLASNVAAISFVARHVGAPRRVVLAGIAYTLGRALTYVLVGILVVSSILSIPSVALFLQERMNQVLGPLLVLIGAVMLGWLRLPTWGRGWAPPERLARSGIGGAGLLGVLFALSFCPVSAGLFFGALIPLSIGADSRVLLPALYGVGTGLPVVVFSVLIVVGAQGVGRAFRVLTAIDRAARPATGVVFILAGLYLTATHVLGLL